MHLFLGTHKDNVADCLGKRRYAKGDKHYRARFTPDMVREARRLSIRYGAVARFAREHGVSAGAVWDVLAGRTWVDVR